MEQKYNSSFGKCVLCGANSLLRIHRKGTIEPYCTQCADNLFPSINIASIISSLSEPHRKLERCPSCGWEINQYTLTGYVGCPVCYYVMDLSEKQTQSSQ